MRVLLINPFYPISETPSPPLGLAFLAGALKRAGSAVKMMDCVVFPYHRERLARLLETFKPHLVGATAVTMTVDNALEIIKDVKALDPSLITVMGGPHATFCASEMLMSFPQVDIVVCGEGETTLVALVRAIQKKAAWNSVPGIAFRNGREITVTPPPLPVDLNGLAQPDRSIIPLGRYLALGMPISMTTSRGCPFKCIFCVGRKMVGAAVRYGHPKRIVDEMETLGRLGFHQINLADDLFTANRRHCVSVCSEILRRRLTTPWTAFARVDTVTREILEKMKQAGCTAVSFGVESGSPEMLSRINKGITLDQVVHAVALCLECGIAPHASFILGLPGETRQTLEETVAFGERLRTMGAYHGFHILAPFPGTDVRQQIGEYDLQILSDDWRQYHANRAIIRTRDVAPEDMDAIVIQAKQQFDGWLGDIGRRRDAGETRQEVLWPLIRLEHTVVLYDMMMKRLVEEKGRWLVDITAGPPFSCVSELVRRVSDHLDHPLPRVEAAIDFAIAHGHLGHLVSDGRVRWSWVDYL